MILMLLFAAAMSTLAQRNSQGGAISNDRFDLLAGKLRRFGRRAGILLFITALLTVVAPGCAIFRPVMPVNDVSITDARQWTRGGMDALDKGRFDSAQEFFQRANEQNPGDERILRGLAESYAGQGEYDQAIGSLQQAISRSNDPQLRVRLGEIYLANGQWLPSRQQAELALESNRKLAHAWLLMGRTEVAKGRYHEALADYHRALSCGAPVCDIALQDLQLEIAAVYQRLNQPERALSTVEQYMSRFPEEEIPEAAAIAKGIALMDMRQYATAVAVLEDAVTRPGATSQAWVRLGQAQLMAGQTSEARTTLARASQLFPDAADLNGIIAQLRSGGPQVALTASDNPEIPR